MIAEFLEHANGFEGLRAFATEQGLDVRGLDEEVVKVFLEGGQVAEDDVLVLNGEVFREDIVGSADNKFVNKRKELGKAFIPFLAVCVRTGCVPASQDGKLVLLSELHSSA